LNATCLLCTNIALAHYLNHASISCHFKPCKMQNLLLSQTYKM